MEKQKDVFITLNDKEVKLPRTFKEKILWLGPSLVLCSIAIGSGEAIITPYFAAMYGLGLFWHQENPLFMVCTISLDQKVGRSLSRLSLGSSLHSSWQ